MVWIRKRCFNGLQPRDPSHPKSVGTSSRNPRHLARSDVVTTARTAVHLSYHCWRVFHSQCDWATARSQVGHPQWFW